MGSLSFLTTGTLIKWPLNGGAKPVLKETALGKGVHV